MDMNDRALRHISIALGQQEATARARRTGFVITAASKSWPSCELARDRKDLRKRLDAIVVGVIEMENPVPARDLRATGGMMALLADASFPISRKPPKARQPSYTPAPSPTSRLGPAA